MIVDFQSDGNTWDSSASNSTRTFSSGDDDIPLLTVDKSEYRAKNVNNALSNQFHDLVVGEIASAHLDTLQTVFEGFPQNKAMEEGFNHKSRDEIAVNSTSNIMPQLDEFISKFLNIALDDAVSLSCKNYGEDFVIKKSSEEEDNDKKEEEENEEEDEEDKLSIIDQEITINEKTEEEKKPNILKSIKSYFTKSKENETKIKNNSSISSNDSSSWLPKTNMKRSNTVSPKSNSIFLNSEDDKNEANEEQSGKKTIFKSLPFFKSKNADNNEGTNNKDEKAQSSFAKTQSSPKILLQKLFSPKSKEISNSNNKKTQHTVRFSDLDENNDRFNEQVDIIENNSYDSFQVNSQPNNDSILNDENKNQLQNSKPVLVENLEDFSSATDSDSPRCHTPNSNPNISNNHLFDILEEEEEEDNEEQGSDEEMVKSLIRPPTPEKEIKEQFSSDSDAKKKNPYPKDISFDSDSSSKHEAKQKHTITSKSGNIQIDISFDSDSSKKTEKKPSGSSIKKDISVDIVTTTKSETINEPGSPNSQKSGRSNKDQDLLLSESDSESVDKIKNKFAAGQANKKGKSNFMAFHLSSSSSEPDTQKQDHLSVKKSEDKQIEVNAKSNDNQKSKIDNDNNKNSLNEGETIKTVLSNVEFIANELSDFELDHENLESEEDQKSSQNKTTQNSVKLKIKNYRKTVKKLKEEEDTEITNTEKKRKVTKRIMSKSSQTLREVPLKRRPNIIQENQSYEIYEGRAGNNNNNDRKRIKKRKIDLPFEKEEEDDDEDEEEMNKKRRKKIRRRKISPSNGKSSNSSSPHSKSSSPTSSPIHTHTHTPVPVKPRLILKNDISSDDEENTLTKPKKVTPIKKKRRSGSITPKSRRSPISSSPTTTTTKTETFSSSPPQNKSKNEVVHSPVIRRRKSSLQAKTIGDSNAFFNDDDRFNVSIKINNQQNKTSPNLQSDVAAKPRQQVARRKRRAASESAPLRIKTTATSKNNSDDDDDSLTVKRKKKTLSRESLLNDDQIRITENLSGPISRIVMDNSEGQAHNRIRTFNQKRKRRLSVDEAVINHKTLAKNGVRSIIVIEFDKKTPIIENFLEQISSNSGAFSQSAAPRSRPSSRCRRTAHTSDDGEFDQNESSGNKTKPKIKKQVKPKISNRQKKKVALSNNLSDEENNNNNDEDNVAVDFASSSKMKDKRKRRQESVKPSSANRSSGPQRRNSNLNDGGERLTKTINKEIITESENLVIHNPIKPNSRSGRRRNASVRSNMGSRKYDDENDDRHYKFNFKKLFDEAEKMQNNKE